MIPLLSLALAAAPPPVEVALRDEMARALTDLRLPDGAPPYLLLYDVLDGEVVTAFAEFGATVSVDTDRYRNLRTEVRVGDYTRDSSNFSSFGGGSGVGARRLPAEDDLTALRREIWLATDASYKGAVESLARKEAALEGQIRPGPADYSRVLPADAPFESTGATVPAQGGRMTAIAETLSAALAGAPGVEVGQAITRDWQGRRLVLTSEGTRVWRATGYTVVRVEGTVRLADGTEQHDSRSWIVRRPEDLPPEAEMLAEVRDMAAWLAQLPKAPKEEDYLGPVLFEGFAAQEVFSQLLTPEILGTPPETEDGGSGGGQVPTARIGRRLLPLGWAVTDDAAGGEGLGAYPSDQEGVAPRRVDLVADGVVRDLLMSRIPRSDRTESTGHGRSLGNDRRAAIPGVVRVEPRRAVSTRRIRKHALRLAAQTGHDYALVIRRLEPPPLSGELDIVFTGEGPLPGLTSPYEAYRLYADGHEEVVRGLRFSGVDRRLLKDIALAAEGAGMIDTLDGPPGPGRYHIGPTGGVPVSWDVPAILVAEVELTSATGGDPRVLKVTAPPAR